MSIMIGHQKHSFSVRDVWVSFSFGCSITKTNYYVYNNTHNKHILLYRIIGKNYITEIGKNIPPLILIFISKSTPTPYLCHSLLHRNRHLNCCVVVLWIIKYIWWNYKNEILFIINNKYWNWTWIRIELELLELECKALKLYMNWRGDCFELEKL